MQNINTADDRRCLCLGPTVDSVDRETVTFATRTANEAVRVANVTLFTSSTSKIPSHRFLYAHCGPRCSTNHKAHVSSTSASAKYAAARSRMRHCRNASCVTVRRQCHDQSKSISRSADRSACRSKHISSIIDRETDTQADDATEDRCSAALNRTTPLHW